MPTFNILNVGAGNSSKSWTLNVGMSEEMYEEGFENVTNVDISYTVIKQMTELYKEKCPNMNCR
jgi:hypothetical protein